MNGNGFEMEMPEKFESESNFLQEPGTYHFVVLAVDEQPTAKNGQLLDGFRVDMAVLDGTVAGQQDKQIDLMFFAPKMTDKNGGEFAKRKMARFALATGIIPEAKPGERVTVNLQDAVGRQLVAEVEQQTNAAGEKTRFLQLAWSNLWHVDDPAVAKIPKDSQALGLLPAKLRKKPEQFQTAKANGGGTGHAKQQTQTPATPTKPAVDINDL